VAAEKKADLLKSLEMIKGESHVVNLSKDTETKFIVTGENTRIQLKVLTVIFNRANCTLMIKRLMTMLYWMKIADFLLSPLMVNTELIKIEKEFKYGIVVVTSKDKQIETEIVEYQHITITSKGNYLIWLTEDEATVYLFGFANADREKLVRVLSVCKYQHATKGRVQETVEDPSDKSWVENYYNPAPGKIEEESKAELDERFEEVKSITVTEKEFPKKLPFTDCVQGVSNNRTFVIMGNNIIVYKIPSEPEMSLEYLAALPVVSAYKGEEYVPKSSILYSSENSMLMVDACGDKTSIYRMDLEKGKVVEEYKMNETIQSIAQIDKNAQLKDQHEFLGISDRGIFTFDPRVSKADKCVAKYFFNLLIGKSISPIQALPASKLILKEDSLLAASMVR
jgi:hypothetical protein